MTVEQFFDSTDIEVHAFEKAYYNRMNTQSWMNGLYNYQAQSIALSNAFAQRDSQRISYPSEPIKMFSEVKEIEDKIEERKDVDSKDLEFRKMMMECY